MVTVELCCLTLLAARRVCAPLVHTFNFNCNDRDQHRVETMQICAGTGTRGPRVLGPHPRGDHESPRGWGPSTRFNREDGFNRYGVTVGMGSKSCRDPAV